MKVTARLSISAEHDAAQHGALEIADAAEHRGGERLQARRIAHEEIDLRVVQPDQHAGSAAQRGAEQKGERDHPAHVHAHDRRHLAILGHRAHAAAERGALDQQCSEATSATTATEIITSTSAEMRTPPICTYQLRGNSRLVM